MAAKEAVIRAVGLGKCYHIYKRPKDRLLQFIFRRRRYFREFWANRGIDLSVRRGETLGIVGRNGAGKTTLLQMIAGTVRPTEGQLEVDGRVTALLELGSGFDRNFTGRENIFLSGAVLGISRKEIERRFDAIVAFADIGDFLEQPVKTYSKGMFVRLAFGVLANLDPDIFLVDEALAVGDAYFRQRCMRRFHEMRENGTTILYVSHDVGGMKRLCDRVLWIDAGRARQIGDPSVVIEEYLSDLFGQTSSEEGAGLTAPSEKGRASIPGNDASGAPSGLSIDERGLELGIPNVDRRLGDQSLEILGLGLFDEAGCETASIEHGRALTLRVSLRNTSGERIDDWVLGYILRNARGEDVASDNSLRAARAFPPLEAGAEATVRVRFSLPLLGGGAYALAPTLARPGPGGALGVVDQIDAAIAFQLVAVREVSCLLALETEYLLEP